MIKICTHAQVTRISQVIITCTLLLSTYQQSRGAPRGPLVEKDPQAQLCTYPTDEFNGEVTLEHNCYYEQHFEINDADTTIDCNGAELRGSGSYLINIKRSADRAQVKNCYLRGGKGLAVRVRQPRGEETPEEVRSLAPEGVVLQNLQISDSEGVGVHLHVYTTGVTIKDSIIINNSSAGFYLSPYGQHHIIDNNLIAGNGHFKPDGTPRLAWYRREGIAVDGSSEHTILNNDIVENAFGGILLYKNCWEHAEAEPNSRPRAEHARANLIQGNRFADQPFGVWVAARQSRDLEQMGCGDPTPYSNPITVSEVLPALYHDYPSSYVGGYLFSLNGVSIWPDFAEENIITENRFEAHSLGGIRVEDDDTEITSNLFIGDFDYIFLGAPFRARLDGHPVLNTLIRDNAYIHDEHSEFIDHLALIPDEHTHTTLDRNERACQLEDGRVLWSGETLEMMTEEICEPDRWTCESGFLRRQELSSDCSDGGMISDSELDMYQTGNLEDEGDPNQIREDGFNQEYDEGTEGVIDDSLQSTEGRRGQGCAVTTQQPDSLLMIHLIAYLVSMMIIRLKRGIIES